MQLKQTPANKKTKNLQKVFPQAKTKFGEILEGSFFRNSANRAWDRLTLGKPSDCTTKKEGKWRSDKGTR